MLTSLEFACYYSSRPRNILSPLDAYMVGSFNYLTTRCRLSVAVSTGLDLCAAHASRQVAGTRAPRAGRPVAAAICYLEEAKRIRGWICHSQTSAIALDPVAPLGAAQQYGC